MRVKFVFSTLVTLLATITFFAFDAIADSGAAAGDYIGLWMTGLVIILIAVGMVCFSRILTRKARVFLKEHSNLLSSEDPKILLELSEKCDEFLKDSSQYSTEIVSLAQQAKTKATRIQKQIDYQESLATFKSDRTYANCVKKQGISPKASLFPLFNPLNPPYQGDFERKCVSPI